MAKDKMQKIERGDQSEGEPLVQKGEDYDYCGKHGVRYRHGGACWQCAEEQRRHNSTPQS